MPERPDPSSWERKDGVSRDDSGFTELHWSNLYDQDEDQAGEKADLATGEAFDNSSSDAVELEGAGVHIEDTADSDASTETEDDATHPEIEEWEAHYKDDIDQDHGEQPLQ